MTLYPLPDPDADPDASPTEDDLLDVALGGGRLGFDAFADLFDRFTGLWDRIDPTFTTWLADQLPARPGRGGRALDLGCGAGRHTVLLAEHYDHVLAVDIAERMLGIAGQTRPADNITYQHGGVLGITPATHGQYDAVLSVHTLHHVGEPGLVLPHVRSLVAPGGIAVLADIIDPGDWTTPDFHADRAFDTARAAYDRSAERHAAADVLRLLLHPQWLKLAAADTPLMR
jgi:2-polyprenyl-3-methyl-5-hydroxy-6-metoxy-1,4-benzoquinol methylase